MDNFAIERVLFCNPPGPAAFNHPSLLSAATTAGSKVPEAFMEPLTAVGQSIHADECLPDAENGALFWVL